VKSGIVALAVVLSGVGCNRPPTSRAEVGQIEVNWTGSERGGLSAPATAEWCSILRQLEIRGVRGDTGFAMILHPTDTVTPTKYRVMDPAGAESLPPAAAIALRWVAVTSVKGFQGESGSVSLHRAPSGEWSGRLTAAARSVSDTHKLTIDGTFKDLQVRPQARGCIRPVEPPDSGAQPLDTPLH
jgi:hypothetical protein